MTITGLVLAGGRGTRIGGADKGLLPYDGTTLAAHALARLRPQVDAVAVNANRHLEAYAALGAPVWPDGIDGFAGPLAGLLSGMDRCATPWLATVPCDAPSFPHDLVARLAAVDATVAIAATPARPQPVFCLAATRLAADLRGFIVAGGRRFEEWARRHGCAVVVFDDEAAFANVNTPDALARLQRGDGLARERAE